MAPNPAPHPPGIRLLTLLTLLAVVPFLTAVPGSPILDDHQYLYRHPVINGELPWWAAFTQPMLGDGVARQTGPSYWRPVVLLVYRGLHAALGPQPIVAHALNLALHATNTLLLLALARRALPPGRAALAAALFAVHPVATEAVAWISGCSDLLAVSATLLALLAWRTRPAVAALCWLVALLSKESAGVWPVLVVLLEPAGSWRSLRRWAPCLVAGGIYLALRLQCTLPAPDTNVAPFGVRLANVPVALGLALRLLVVPWPLGFQRRVPLPASDPWWEWLPGVLLVLAACWLLWRRAALRGPVGWVLVTLLPVTGLLPIVPMDPGTVPFSERHLYLPLAGFALLGSAVLASAPRWVLVAGALAAIALGTLSALRFQSSEALLTHAVRVSPRSAGLWCTLGEERLLACFNLQDPVASAAQARTAVAPLEQAIRLMPQWTAPVRSLAMAHASSGALARAEDLLRTHLRAHAEDAVACYYLATVLMLSGREGESRTWLDLCLQRDPQFQPARANLEWLAQRRGNQPLLPPGMASRAFGR